MYKRFVFIPLFLQALCVLMSKQQDRVDQMNLLSPSFLHGSASLNIILEERLREVNSLWKEVQMRASSKQEVLERCVQEQTQNLESTRQQEVMAFTENFSFLRSLYLTVDCCDDVCKNRKMSPTIRHKYKYLQSTVQRAKDRRRKFHFSRLPLDVRPRNVKVNLSKLFGVKLQTSHEISHRKNNIGELNR